MDRRRIGRSSLVVSDICLGTMTFGSSCDEAEAFRIMDRAFDAGIDFLDAAEIYPTPPDKKWVNRTEEIVGRWMQTKPRDAGRIATKFCGPGHGWFVPPVREGHTGIDRHHIRRAVEGSLKRLQTDYIDLYQTHWPDHDFPYEHTLEVLDELVVEGKIRYVGCSNETPWGLMKSLAASENSRTVRYESIQNNFSLINRRFEDSLAEICKREKISCLPYSPIGGGVLSGKYLDGNFPEGARFSNYMKNGGERQKVMTERFINEKSLATTAALQEIARELEIPLVALATAWSKQHDFVASTIIGANSVAQLDEILLASDLTLTDETLSRIDEITNRYPYPLG